jgi:hypothetical protein
MSLRSLRRLFDCGCGPSGAATTSVSRAGRRVSAPGRWVSSPWRGASLGWRPGRGRKRRGLLSGAWKLRRSLQRSVGDTALGLDDIDMSETMPCRRPTFDQRSTATKRGLLIDHCFAGILDHTSRFIAQCFQRKRCSGVIPQGLQHRHYREGHPRSGRLWLRVSVAQVCLPRASSQKSDSFVGKKCTL